MVGVERIRRRFDWRSFTWLGLVLAVLIVYAPSFRAQFLNYDDPWLISGNPFLARNASGAPWAILTDFSKQTRLALGAEYLPMRDVLAWLETRCFGLSARRLHMVSVFLYALAAVLMRGALVRSFGRSLAVDLAAFLFALHPVHAESAGWVAGQKDVLALCFVGAALYVHAGTGSERRWWVPVLVLAACFSKSMSVAVLGLMLAQDLALRRKPEVGVYAGTLTAVALSMAVHLYVGRIVGMLASPLGGSTYHAFLSMGPVWLQYAALCFCPWLLSITHDVPALTHWTLGSLIGYLFVLVSLAVSIAGFVGGHRRPLIAWLWFFVPLAPVSQVLLPLQNPMADRYLWLSVMAPCLVVAWGIERLFMAPERAPQRVLGLVASAVLVLFAMGSTWQRSRTFSNSVAVFEDATRKTRLDPVAPFQLGKALETDAQREAAIETYRALLERIPDGNLESTTEVHMPLFASGAGNLARLLGQQDRWAEAERVLRAALVHFPTNEPLRRHLAQVLRALNRNDEAAQVDPGFF